MRKSLTEDRLQAVLFPHARGARIRPLLKWAGGKAQLLPILRRLVPTAFARYVEPFLGGGAVFWHLALPGSLVSDINDELVHFYRVVRDHPDRLLELVGAMPVSKNDFYRIRAQRTACLGTIERAARFVYLNKTCYNGLYRVNRKGQFNTPFGGKTEVTILDEDNLYKASWLLQGTELLCRDYTSVLSHLKSGDFVYLDPPYLPVGKYSDFRRYTSETFTEQDHENLADAFSGLAERGIKALLSNSFNELFNSLYRGHWYTYVLANRQINSRPGGRGKIKEILVANYPLEGFSVLS
jgi:DNA adenine methylase